MKLTMSKTVKPLEKVLVKGLERIKEDEDPYFNEIDILINLQTDIFSFSPELPFNISSGLVFFLENVVTFISSRG